MAAPCFGLAKFDPRILAEAGGVWPRGRTAKWATRWLYPGVTSRVTGSGDDRLTVCFSIRPGSKVPKVRGDMSHIAVLKRPIDRSYTRRNLTVPGSSAVWLARAARLNFATQTYSEKKTVLPCGWSQVQWAK